MNRTRLVPILLFCVMASAGVACSSAEEKAAELYSIAEFEERQFNPEHASEIYREVLDQYPETSWAGRASERLKALEQTAQP